jgi:TonB-dependent SusC/RagA subfamily outer membrane receptor
MKKLQLLLTNPCAENWDEMLPSEAGRYCNTCAKHVIDLTKRSDAELIDFFTKKKDNVCGRLLSTQLDREITAPTQKPNWHWLWPIVMGASIFTPAKASALKPVTVHNDGILPRVQKIEQSQPIEKAKLDTIKGTVIDETTGKPLAGVKITQKGFKNVIALTDSAGHFMLSMAPEESIYPLVFNLNNYSSIEKEISANMVIKLSKVQRIMVGGIHAINTSNQPLYVVYVGDKSCILEKDGQLKDINPEWIEKLEILKDAKAAALYGSKAANGVILIGIKKKYANKIDFSKKK